MAAFVNELRKKIIGVEFVGIILKSFVVFFQLLREENDTNDSEVALNLTINND